MSGSFVFTLSGRTESGNGTILPVPHLACWGSIVAGTTYIAELVDPKYGGILTVAPIIMTLVFLFTSMQLTQERTQDFILLVPTALFLVSLYLLLGRYGVVVSIIGSTRIWLVSVVIVAKCAGLL